MLQLVQVTAQYSNAVLVAILPFLTDFAQNLDLPIRTPVTASQVAQFRCSPRRDDPGGWVVLTNGYEFAFVNGGIGLYRSPRSYFSLQDARRVPEFYGPVVISREDALVLARTAIAKLGYANTLLHVNDMPEATDLPRNGTNSVPRYRFKWGDPKSRSSDGKFTHHSADIEINASSRQIEMLYLLGPATWRPPLHVDVQPPPAREQRAVHPEGTGRRILPVNQAYSQAFLSAILPQLSDYITKAGFSVPVPISTNDVDLARYTCGILAGQPYAQVYLRSGYRFNYSHGQVIACYAADASRIPGEEQRRVEQFFGPLNISTNKALALVRQAVRRLGYCEKVLQIEEPPGFVPPYAQGTNSFARYFMDWQEPKHGPFRVAAEVDATTGTLKSLYINASANTNIWRSPPSIAVPMRPPLPGEEGDAPGAKPSL